jgi:uncharacterized protein YrzB (UPF0473 family)
MADINNNEEMNEEIIIIELTDDEGTTTEFEYLDTIALDGEEYVVLIENVEDADGVIILKIVSVDDENETYEGVEDEEVVQKVYEMFKENRKDDFDFTD